MNYMPKIFALFAFFPISFLFGVLIPVTGVTVDLPTGGNNPSGANSSSNPYVDDVYLRTISFGSVTFDNSAGQTRSVISGAVGGDRSQNNAEWGSQDDSLDGDPDPFTRAGLDPSLQETPDPAIQDLGLLTAFSGFSLTEGSDGEASGGFFDLIFENGIQDNDTGVDDTPEIVIFERGNNDTTTIELITGGTFDNPTFADNSITVATNDLSDTGIWIQTQEINSGQELAAAGWDLNDFFTGTPQTVYGIRLTSNGGDFYGQFVTADNPTQFVPQLPELLSPIVVPEVGSVAMVVLSFTAFFLVGRQRRRR